MLILYTYEFCLPVHVPVPASVALYSRDRVSFLSFFVNNISGIRFTMSTGASTRKLIVGNLGTHITAEDLRSFFGLDRDDRVKSMSGVELSDTPKGNVALVHVPEDIFHEVRSKHGQELSGRIVCIRDPEQAQPALTTLANVASWNKRMDFGEFQSGGPPKNGPQQGTSSSSSSSSSSKVIKVVNLNNINDIDAWLKHPENVYIGREKGAVKASIWANPFIVGEHGTREQCVHQYEDYVRGNEKLMLCIGDLRGKTLGCWCSPSLCHGLVLQRLGEESGSYSNAAASGLAGQVHDFVEIDTTYYNDCRHLPTTAAVCHAIKTVFGTDEDRRTIAPRRENAGVYRLEVADIEKYKGVEDLEVQGVKIAKVVIRREKVVVSETGQIRRQREHDPNDLFIKLVGADSFPLNQITDEEIVDAILDMDLGQIKRAPQRLRDRRKMEFTGDKFFVLKNVSTEDRQRIRREFIFDSPTFGKLAIRLNHRFQIRFCSYCGKMHDAVCPVREKVEALRAQKAVMTAQKSLPLKVIGDSTIRYLNETAVQGDVEAMSGGTTGNLLNALDVDENLQTKETVVLVSGSNEKKARYSPAEYIYTLKKIRERVSCLLSNSKKNVALIPPPAPKDFASAEEEVREEIFKEHLQQMKEGGIKVWDNPIDQYDEDDGMHPSPDQSLTLSKFISENLESAFKTPFLMASATEEVTALPNKYWHVTSFYKFGCGACSSRTRNKWYNICDDCKQAASTDEGVQEKVKWYTSRVDELMPALRAPDGEVDSSDDELRCEECDVVFLEMKDVKAHFKESHPGAALKFKRGKTSSCNVTDDGKNGSRRKKTVPQKSLK